MHSAPSVNYPVGRSRYAERLLLGLWALGVLGVTVACVQAAGFDWRQGILALSAAVAGLAAWTGVLRCTDPADLSFDGQHWSISGHAALRTAQASVVLDLQALLLVHLSEPARARRWVWVDRRAMPERWRDLRRALYSRAPSPEPTAQKADSKGVDVHHSSS
ncbi:hypothetical protein QTI24_07350 [Variovorax sp. J22P240]|uniref:hypothetical protein n=1 Tax=Variovorax sp. J22P240 TaxID=3053514 RepID=UPI002576589A|nr:hypothetical protein [Variovorax sp. J22P240]MDL9998408.1 hypothetical protein [Variovorax sp. J22P240]